MISMIINKKYVLFRRKKIRSPTTLLQILSVPEYVMTEQPDTPSPHFNPTSCTAVSQCCVFWHCYNIVHLMINKVTQWTNHKEHR